MAEMIFTINIRKSILEKPRWERSKYAVRAVRNFLKKKMKTDKIKLDNSISQAIWTRGATKPLNKIRVKVEKDEEGIVKASLIEENQGP
ncbi:MAG: 60S ribosomal protein L31 [Candidatus Aenigmarchaeota archaeon]|nr:60S ribosomal protein L31 [Candidatus Aenigmarchaeota archaeon]